MATVTKQEVVTLVAKDEEPPIPPIVAAKSQIIKALENWQDQATWLKFQILDQYFGNRFDFGATLRKRLTDHYARRGLKLQTTLWQEDEEVFLYVRKF